MIDRNPLSPRRAALRSRALSLLLLSVTAIAGPAAAGSPGSAAKPDAVPMLPARMLKCVLGRMTNLDPKIDQTTADIIFEGHHEFDLFLPAIPVRQKPPPDAVDQPEPVDPRTRIVADPDKLTAGFPDHFDRVVDYWPDRVEMTTTIDEPRVNLIVIHPIDEAGKTANLFMTQATDVATYDLAHAYSGPCKIEEAPGR